ncbi:sensor histidine kinase [Alkaliphilus peptidifermentans]|uniref:histidine kinase n=1 Tax=Alkaliphilus peptidifermentans DSM 18978 TaxID=1120976 RepID=A0A1G5FXB1_9FIRM|nr:HAMP domain-containing sensor histidine kinase [Alkaliphilus peptidifermentans]SCY43799.1 Histidine kinase-, DNA gyrase B-, and HSP90-like ATPase [Alkaliphilus peptidifermentans DSM 18978]
MDTNSNNNIEGNKEEIDKSESFVDKKLEENHQTQSTECTESKKLVIENKGKNYIPVSLITILVLIMFTVLAVGSYVPIKDYMFSEGQNTESYFQSYDFTSTLANLTNYLNQTKIQGNDWYNSSYENITSIKYFIRNNDKDINISNINNITDNNLQEEIVNSQFYLNVLFDDEGNPTKIEASKQFNKEAFLINFIYNDEIKVEYANLEITYIVPEDFESHNDIFTRSLKRSYAMHDNLLLILAIGAVAFILLTIIAFAVPYSYQNTLFISTIFNKMFLEVKVLLWLGFLFVSGPGIIILGAVDIIEVIYDASIYFYLLGIPITFAFFLLCYLTIIYIKYIYHIGFMEGVIHNSIIGKICMYFFNRFKESLKDLMYVSSNSDIRKKLVLILGINLMVLWVIAALGTLGYILAVIYSIFLFEYLLKVINKAKALTDASSQLAEGNFDIELEEDIGILSPISKNLNNIKEGFKLAVDKEIKSERMKAELISNVSHDLKTPLTSIITYVDLLKDEGISPNTHREYIEILDKKSKRLQLLIEDLFEASKANSGSIDLNLERVDVIALFRQTLGELEEKIVSSSLSIKTDAPDDKIICELDGKRTYRIFENIMSNTLKYSMANSRVYINIEENIKEVRFVFRNISNYEMNFDASEITERFTRGDRSRNAEGSGLGLAIAKSFIELQKGKLEISIDGDLFKLIVTFPKA